MNRRFLNARLIGAPYQGTAAHNFVVSEMSRAVYENTAGVIRRLSLPEVDRQLVALSFARQYAGQNAGFKPKVFFKACGFDDETVAKLVGLGM